VLEAVAATLPKGESPVGIGPLPEVFGDHDNVGPDCRFFLRARALGYRLWLDAGIESLHATTIWLGHKSAGKLIDYTKWANGAHEAWEERIRLHGMNSQAFKMRKIILEARKAGMVAQFDEARSAGADLESLQAMAVALHEMNGKIMECQAWLEAAEAYPPIEHPQDLPTSDNFPPVEVSNDAKSVREQAFTERAAELVTTLPDIAPEQVSPNGHSG